MLSTTSVQFLLLLSIKNLHMILPYTDIVRDFICYCATLLYFHNIVFSHLSNYSTVTDFAKLRG